MKNDEEGECGTSVWVEDSSFLILHFSLLIYIRYNTFPSSHGLGTEFFHIPIVYGIGAWHQVGGGPPHKDPRGGGGGQQGKACPFHQFAEVIGRGDIFVESACRQVMAGVAGLAQVADDVVGMQVDAHSHEEEQEADEGVRLEQVIQARSGLHAGEPEDASRLHHPVEHIEHDAHCHDAERHPAFSFHQEGEDEGTLQVVQLEEQEEKVLRHRESRATLCPKDEHHDEYRGLHQHPAELVVDAGSPLGGAEDAIARADEIE